jgi:hypothetical protein
MGDGVIGEVNATALQDPVNPFWSTFTRVLSAVAPLLVSAAQSAVAETQGDTMFAAPAADVSVSAGVSWDLVNQSAASWADARAGALVTELADETRDAIARAIASWMRDGRPLGELSKAIDAIIDNPVRARLIAATEVTTAFAKGNSAAWQAAGLWGRMWQIVQDGHVCRICEPLHDQVQPFGLPFIHPETGDEIDDPGVDSHPRCRCYLLPVVRMPSDWQGA